MLLFMSNDIYLIGEVGSEITLSRVIEKIKDTDPEKPLNVHIHSPGGSVYDGLAIYNHLKNLDREVNTISSGLVASIASIIFLAGNKETRKINRTDSFLIHLPSSGMIGNAEDLEKTAAELRKIESQLAEIYAAETDITKEEAIDLMNNEDFIDPDFLKEKGFVSDIVEFKAVANLINKNDKMTKLSNEDKNWFTSMFNKVLNPKPEPVNKIVQDANGVEIDFTEVEEDATPQVGDKAKVDGADASGEYVMPSGETYVFEAGELTEIQPAEDVAATESDEVAQLKEENDRLKAELENLKNEKETLTNEITTANNSIKDLKKDFTEMKAKITSSFEWDGKETKEKKPESRSFYGSK